MKYFFILLASYFYTLPLNAQVKEIPKQYLEYLVLECKNRKHRRPEGCRILSKSKYSKEFLIKNLERDDLTGIIAWMGRTKDTTFIPYIKPFLESPKPHERSYALSAMRMLGYTKNVSILENMLSKETDPAVLNRLIFYLKTHAKPSSVKPLEQFLTTLDMENSYHRRLKKQTEEALELIQLYDTTASMKEKILLEYLFSKDEKKNAWSMFHIRKNKDPKYIGHLKALQAWAVKENYRVKALQIFSINLRLYLGDTEFTAEETSIIKEKKLGDIDNYMEEIQAEIQELSAIKKWGEKD